MTEEDCVIVNGRLDPASCMLTFDQVYLDGPVTKWRARYDRVLDAFVEGAWSGECEGTFEAVRKNAAGDEGVEQAGSGDASPPRVLEVSGEQEIDREPQERAEKAEGDVDLTEAAKRVSERKMREEDYYADSWL
eukprot:COSAG04_NODE_6166_length_1393_cov_2.472179_2_plen_134_part_00